MFGSLAPLPTYALIVLTAATAWLPVRSASAQDRVPTAAATRVTTPVRLDGSLGDEAWARATPIGALTQREPTEGAPASEATEVRVIFDSENLYFGIVCRDRTPPAIVSTQLGRDAELDVDDQLTIVLGPFADQRNGFFFIVNPAGARADGQISNNASEVSLEWDGIWDARARITAEGWVAEIAIPFKTLRFKPGESVWELNVERQVKRTQERSRWASPRNDVWLTNLAAAGRLSGLEGIQQGRGLDIKPFVSGGEKDRDGAFKAGLDVVKAITPNLTGSITVNTDFAETEVDSRQVNLTRFPLFFPEKRGFFLEGAGVYDVAGLGGGGGRPDLLPFFSRTVGLYEGEEVPILVGAKLSGRHSGFNVGVLDVQTRQTTLDEGELGSQNLFAARVSRNLFAQSSVGAIVTSGSPSGEGRNTLIGVDAHFATSRFRGDKNLSLDLFALRTDDGPTNTVAYATGAKVEYPNDLWRGSLGIKQIDDGFRPAMGFAPRTGIRKADGELMYQPRPGRYGIRKIAFGARSEVVANLQNRAESWEVFTQLPEIEFESGDQLALNTQTAFERLEEPFEIQPGVLILPGSYRWTRTQMEISTASKRPVVMETAVWLGGFYRGTMWQVESQLIVKPSNHVAFALQYERSDADLPEGRFVAQLFSGRLDYSASPNVSWSNQIQYDTDSRELGFQSRFRWILKPGNDLFLVVGRGWYRRNDGAYIPTFDNGSAKLVYTIRL